MDIEDDYFPLENSQQPAGGKVRAREGPTNAYFRLIPCMLVVLCVREERILPSSPPTTNLVFVDRSTQAKASKAKQPFAVNNNAGGQGKTIEEVYQKKTQLEHILLRPDTYIGSTEKQQQSLWVHNGTNMELRNVNYAPGLYKIFDEVLVNAADHKVRDPTMDTLKVTIDAVSTESMMPAARGPVLACLINTAADRQ